MTIDWNAKIITVEMSDLTQVETTPLEGYTLDMLYFKDKMIEFMMSEDGQSYPAIIEYTPEKNIDDAILAPVVELINDYKVEFTDGQYYVKLINANTNLVENVIQNTVSIRSGNTAGLQSIDFIKTSVYGGKIYVDTVSGTTYNKFPSGTLQFPLKDIGVAINLAKENNIDTIVFLTDTVIPDNTDLSNLKICGIGKFKTIITSNETVIKNNTKFYDCIFYGVLTDNCLLTNSTIDGTISSNFATIENCVAVSGKIDCYSNSKLFIKNLSIINNNGFEINVGDTDLTIAEFTGKLIISNKTGTNEISIATIAGNITLTDTCTAGQINISGGYLEDNSQDACTVTHNTVDVPAEVLDNLNQILAKVSDISEVEFGNWKIENNKMIFYKQNGDVLATFGLFDKNGNPTETAAYQRIKE